MALLLIGGSIFLHEVTHMQIFNYYGINDYWIEWGDGYVAVNYKGECNDVCELAHSINEIVHYNVSPFLIIIILLMLIKDETKKS